jgi:Uma2 family endonuclease
MVTAKPTAPTTQVESDGQPEWELPLVGELRLNLSALGVDVNAPDFAEQLCQLSTENQPWEFEISAKGELIVVPPTGSDSSIGETEINVDLGLWTREHDGQNFPPTVLFRLPSGAAFMPDASWITQDRFDNRTDEERRGAINGAPDFVVEVRSQSDRLAPFLAKMQEWVDGGARLGWGIDGPNARAYVYRPGQEVQILDNPENLSGEDVLPGFEFAVRTLVFDRYRQPDAALPDADGDETPENDDETQTDRETDTPTA